MFAFSLVANSSWNDSPLIRSWGGAENIGKDPIIPHLFALFPWSSWLSAVNSWHPSLTGWLIGSQDGAPAATLIVSTLLSQFKQEEMEKYIGETLAAGLLRASFLGFVAQQGHLSLEPTKVSAVEEWPTPSSCKQLQHFMNFAIFFIVS